jgi:DNA-binding transcriptional ArsR family regulator
VTASATAAFIAAIAEPTRLRIVNCVTTAPLFVSDLVAILDLRQPTVSRHLRVLRDAGVVTDLPIPPFAIYSLLPQAPARQRVLRAVLDAALTESAFRTERDAALARTRESVRARVTGAGAHAG